MLKNDKKQEIIDSAEKLIREELYAELKNIKVENKKLNEKLIEVSTKYTELETLFKICKHNHPHICPLFQTKYFINDDEFKDIDCIHDEPK